MQDLIPARLHLLSKKFFAIIKIMKKYIQWVIIILVIIGGIYLLSNKDKSPIQTGGVNSLTQNIKSVTDLSGQQTIINSNNKEKTMTTATLKTNKGDITIEFLDNIAPKTVANFIKLAKDGFYDGVKFHRVINDFMIQGGDPLTKDDSKKDLWGTGDPGYKFDDEITADSKNNIGFVAMANSGPNTNGSQFYINVKDNNFLDGKYTVFGRVTAGMDTVNVIKVVLTYSFSETVQDVPVEDVIIESVKVN